MVIQASVLDDDHTTPSSRQRPQPGSTIAIRIEVVLLGGFEVSVAGRAVASRSWSRRHSSSLLKLLALAPGRSLHRELVMDALWPDLGIEEAAPRLHKAAHYARKALSHQDAVVLSADTVTLCPDDDVWIDAVHFRQRAEDALRDLGVASAEGALALYGGDLLPQDLYEPWADVHRIHLRRLYLEMLHQAEEWHRALAADPTDEPAHLALVEHYAERGNRVAALRQLDQLDHIMREDLGLNPSERALELRRQLADPAHNEHPSDDVKRVRPDPSPAAEPPQTCCA